jgi:preprotein translocase subunit YajC
MDWMILAAQPQAAPAGAGMTQMFVMLAFIAVFWFFLFWPQRKQQKQRNQMLKNLKKGDKVITVGGLHGEIVDFEGDDDVRLRVADKTELKFTRSSVARVK